MLSSFVVLVCAKGHFARSVVNCTSFFVVLLLGLRFLFDPRKSKFLTPCGISITTPIFFDFFNAPQNLHCPPRLVLLGPENFSLNYTFKVYVALEPYGLLFQKFVFFQAMPKSAMHFERWFHHRTVKALDNLRGYVALNSPVRAIIGSPYMDRELRDLNEEARRIQAAECPLVARLESEARAELCLHMEVGYKRLGLLHKALNAKACDAWGRMTTLQAEAFGARDRVAAEEVIAQWSTKSMV